MNSRIVSDPDICGGEYCLQGRRIPVNVILSHLAAGETYDVVLKNFPNIEMDDIYACLDFAKDMTSEKTLTL